MKFVKALSVLSIAVLGMGVMAARASAEQTFAYWGENSPAQLVFSFTNSGSASVLTGTDSDVYFNVVNGQDAGQNFNATVTVTGTATGAGFQLPPVGNATSVYQPLSSLTETFTENGGPNPGANLLTVQINSMAYLNGNTATGLNNGETATYSNSTASNAYFTSSVLDFTNAENEGVDLDLNSITQPINLNANSYLNSFVATAGGDFADQFPTAPSTPEPNPAIAVGLALAGIAGLVIYKNKRASTIA